jgi:hypothetical protein
MASLDGFERLTTLVEYYVVGAFLQQHENVLNRFWLHG